MKKILINFIAVLAFISLNAQNYIVKTEDGRRVLLKSDNTWEFVDGTSEIKKSENQNCNLPENFEEPNGKSSMFLKKGDATIKDLKKHVSIDMNCEVSDIILIRASEQKGNGNYVLCVKGKEERYRRIGSVFLKSDEKIFGN
jgi:uncharacterized protein YxeA